jgi:hypothetical protein
MQTIKSDVLDYYENLLRVAETEKLKTVRVKPDELRSLIAAARAMAEAEHIVRAINEAEVGLVRAASAPNGASVAQIRATFARLRAAAAPYA